jgi:hypothetical protein
MVEPIPNSGVRVGGGVLVMTVGVLVYTRVAALVIVGMWLGDEVAITFA